MSQKDFEAAITRLKQANQDTHWARSVLDNPSTLLKDYDLTQEETEALFQQFHALLAEIHTAQAHILLKRVNVQIENKKVQIVGPVPPWLNPTAIVGPGEPWKPDAVGPIEPYDPSHHPDVHPENQPHT